MSTASDMLAKYLAAEQAVLAGQSYQWGERRLTLADLEQIRAGRQEWQTAVNAEQRARSGGGRFRLADFSGCDR